MTQWSEISFKLMNYLFLYWLNIQIRRILPWWKEWKYYCLEYGTFLPKIQNQNNIFSQTFDPKIFVPKRTLVHRKKTTENKSPGNKSVGTKNPRTKLPNKNSSEQKSVEQKFSLEQNSGAKIFQGTHVLLALGTKVWGIKVQGTNVLLGTKFLKTSPF